MRLIFIILIILCLLSPILQTVNLIDPMTPATEPIVNQRDPINPATEQTLTDHNQTLNQSTTTTPTTSTASTSPATTTGVQECPSDAKVNAYFNLVFGAYGTVLSAFFFFTFIALKQGRKPPGDIVFVIAVFILILSLYWFTFAFKIFIRGQNTNFQATDCQIWAFLQLWCYCGIYCYNFAYFLMLRKSISNVLKTQSNLTTLITHSSCLIISLILPIYIMSTKQIGNLLYLCSYQEDFAFIVLNYCIYFLYMITCVYTIWFFQKNIPNDERLKKIKGALTKRYMIYIFSTCIMFTAQVAANTFLQQKQCNLYLASLITQNFFFLLAPSIMAYNTLKNPQIHQRLLYYFKIIFSLNQYQDDNQKNLLSQDNEIEDSDNQLKELKGVIREFQIRSILVGIQQYFSDPNRLSDPQNKNVQQNSVTTSIDLKEINNDEEQDKQAAQIFSIKTFLRNLGLSCVKLNNEFQFSVDLNFKHNLFDDQVQNELLSDSLQKMKMQELEQNPKMSVLSPLYFEQLFLLDHIHMDAASSFDCNLNAEQIAKQVGPDGGKSGEFFFFTHDNQWILKTISEEELDVFRIMMPQYMQHMHLNKNSLINKIYGIFSLNLNQMSAKYNRKDINVIHFAMQRNITYIGGKYITRCFDMKGSEYQREVLAKQNKDLLDLSKITLKDKDFDITEGTVKVNEELLPQLRLTLAKDASFFSHQNLMDYSLLIMKISWGKYYTDKPEADRNRMNTLSQAKFSVLPQIPQDEGQVYYHLAVIDYLQLWNSQKIAEKLTKQLINLDKNLDTSAQNPKVYADRFCDNLVNKIFQKDQNDFFQAERSQQISKEQDL